MLVDRINEQYVHVDYSLHKRNFDNKRLLLVVQIMTSVILKPDSTSRTGLPLYKPLSVDNENPAPL